MKRLACVLPLFALACGDDAAAPGTLGVYAYGEEFIEDGIPADVFADGWKVEFAEFLIAISGVVVTNTKADAALGAASTFIVDLAQFSGDGHLLVSGEVPGGRYDDTKFTVAPALGAVAANATPDQVAFMNDNALSIFVTGRATKGAVEKTFAWRFTSTTRYTECESTAKVDGDAARTVLTIHADHLFYDSLVSTEPDVRFQLFADADLDGNHAITMEELAAVDITGLDNYQVGNDTDVTDLAAFLVAHTATLGHIDGEGHCHTD